jgi:hypothetical protein
MVSNLSWLLIGLLAGSVETSRPVTPIAVVRRAESVEIESHGATVPPSTGRLLGAGERLVTQREGYVELYLPSVGTVLLFGGSRMQLLDPAVNEDWGRLERGRMWITRPAKPATETTPVNWRVGPDQVRLPPGVKVSLEVGSHSDRKVVVSIGQVTVRAGTRTPIDVDLGHVATWRSDRNAWVKMAGDLGRARLGEREQLRRQGDVLAARRSLVEWLDQVPFGTQDRAGMRPIHWGTSDVMGAIGGPAGSVLEEALRPPPFFETEVPAKGPNVEVEVGFEP